MIDFLPYLLGATLLGLLGGAVPIVREPSSRIRSYVQHLAAGLLLAVIAIELTPELRDLDQPQASVLGLVIGALMMIGLKFYSRHIEKNGSSDRPYGMVGAAMVDTAIDGALVGAGYVINPQLGVLLAIGLGLDLAAVAASLASESLRQGMSRAASAGLVALVVVMLPIGAIFGIFLFAQAGDWVRALVLSVATAALLYLVTDELLARGQEARDSTGSVAFFFAGFVGLAAYAMIIVE